MARLTSNFKGRLHKYFQIKLGAFPYRNGWVKSTCPYCGRELKFGINLSQNRCHCFRCEVHPSPIDLVMYLEHVDTFAEVVKILENETYSGYVFKEEKVEIASSKPIYLPEGFYLLNQGNNRIANAARNYVRKRGFDPDTLSKWGWGYGTKGKYFGYLIIPFHEHGRLVYFNARLFLGNGPRYNNPDTTESGIGKSYILYNRDALSIYKSVFLAEGAINAATMGERGIASGGKQISRYQINLILRSPVERVIILFDPDAKEKAIDIALQLVNYKKVKVVFLPDGKDCNDLGREEVLRYVYSTHYLSYQELIDIKYKLKWEQQNTELRVSD